MRLRRSLLILGALALFAALGMNPNAAYAHANYVRSAPAAEAAIFEAPALVQIWFSEPLSLGGSRLGVRDTSGRQVDKGDARLDPGDDRSMRVSLPPLPPGVYTVLWETTSVIDGHSLAGAFPFTVGESAPVAGFAGLAREVERAVQANQTPAGAGVASRWMVLLALVALGGATVFTPLFMASPNMTAARAQTTPARRRWLLAFIVLSAVAFGFEAAIRAESGGLVVLMSDRYGLTLTARAALLAGLIGLWRARRETGWASPLLSGLLLFTQSANSHSAAEAGSLPLLADWLHLVFAAIWLGGVVQLALVDAPLALRRGDADARAEFGALIAQFSPWVMLCVLGLALTGLAQSAAFVESIEALSTTAYGRALSLKLALFGALLVFGAVHQFGLAPRLREIRKRAAATPDRAVAARAMRVFRTSVGAEAAAAGVTLMAAGLLISLPPSRDVRSDPTLISSIQTRGIGNVTLTLGVSSAEAGSNQFVLRVDAPTNAPVEDAVLRIEHETINTGLTEIVLAPYARPLYAARSSALALQGKWKIEAIVRRAGMPDTRAEFAVVVEK